MASSQAIRARRDLVGRSFRGFALVCLARLLGLWIATALRRGWFGRVLLSFYELRRLERVSAILGALSFFAFALVISGSIRLVAPNERVPGGASLAFAVFTPVVSLYLAFARVRKILEVLAIHLGEVRAPLFVPILWAAIRLLDSLLSMGILLRFLPNEVSLVRLVTHSAMLVGTILVAHLLRRRTGALLERAASIVSAAVFA